MTNINNYYFTFGDYDELPYKYGYVIIKATDYWQARSKFKERFGMTRNRTLPFMFEYDQSEWDAIIESNGGKDNEWCKYVVGACHEVIE